LLPGELKKKIKKKNCVTVVDARPRKLCLRYRHRLNEHFGNWCLLIRLWALGTPFHPSGVRQLR
jgi:hypothetical protein